MTAGLDTPTAMPRMRLDKWLWAARFFKTRSLATREARAGRIRLNGTHVSKANTLIGAGDVLTFPKARRVWVIKVVELAERRGPAKEAACLYEDLSAPMPPEERQASAGKREKGAGRPTKAERRALDRFQGRYGDDSL